MSLMDYLPSRDTLKYDLNILGAILIGLPAYYQEFPIISPKAQQIISFAATIYCLATGMARPTPGSK